MVKVELGNEFQAQMTQIQHNVNLIRSAIESIEGVLVDIADRYYQDKKA